MDSIKEKLLKFLSTGISPERLAFCISLGIVLGIIPALGTTTMLCAVAAFLFRLNIAAIQLVNYFVYPLQLILLIPFIRAGERLFGVESLELSLELIQGMMREDLWKTIIGLWQTTFHAVIVWILVAPVVVACVYIVLKPLLKKLRLERLMTSNQN